MPDAGLRPRLAMIIGLLLLAGSEVACSSRDSSEPRPRESSHASTGSPRLDGLTIRVLTFTGPPIAEPLRRRALEFTERTGAAVDITMVPFRELYQTALADFEAQTARYDVVVFAPQWLVDFAEPGYLEDLSERVAATPALEWDDIAPFFRDFSAMYKGRIYTVPLDGDFQMVYSAPMPSRRWACGRRRPGTSTWPSPGRCTVAISTATASPTTARASPSAPGPRPSG